MTNPSNRLYSDDEVPHHNLRIKVLHYNFSPMEIHTLYRFIMSAGYIGHDDEELNQVINRICEIARTDELVIKSSRPA